MLGDGMTVELIKVDIKRVIGPTPSGAAVLLGNEQKTFVVFVGFYEAAALIREMNDETPARPLTHELLQSVFLGFDLEVKKVVVSSIIDSTFCATLILQQKSKNGAATRNEVRIDARPSDCLILALKNKVDIYVADEVFNQVQDVSKMAADVESNLVGMSMGDLDFDLRSQESGNVVLPGSEQDDMVDLDTDEDDDYLGDDDEDEDERTDPEGVK
ncbi:MAG: bifunctional nuclease family protein [Planctomycetota bacterium]|nr:bifunctional nuclease family protein [Planctomycetota bacterium]